MHLNRVTIEDPSKGPSLQGPQKQSYEVGEGDFFWEANGRAPFEAVAAEIEVQLQQYKQVPPNPHLLPFCSLNLLDVQGSHRRSSRVKMFLFVSVFAHSISAVSSQISTTMSDEKLKN